MERLASYSLDSTPGCPAGAAPAFCAGRRVLNGPSFRKASFPIPGGLSVCSAEKRPKDFLGQDEYSSPRVCNEIPGFTVIPSAAAREGSVAGLPGATGEKSAPSRLLSGQPIEYNVWFPGLFEGGRSTQTNSGRALPPGFRASRRFHPAGLGPAQHVLNGEARSVTSPFLPLVAETRNPGANSCDLPQCCGIRKEDLYVG